MLGCVGCVLATHAPNPAGVREFGSLCLAVLDLCWQRTRQTARGAFGNLCWICIKLGLATHAPNSAGAEEFGNVLGCVGFVLDLYWQHMRQTQQALGNLAICVGIRVWLL